MGLMKQSSLRAEQLEDRCLMSANVVTEWNQLTLDAIGQARLTPVLSSRVLAMTQAAVYDAVNAIDGTYKSYAFPGQAPQTASHEAAAAGAAYHTLIELFPDRRADFDAALASSLATIPDGPAENQGVAVGQAAAQTILALRRHDGFDAAVPYTPGTDPGDWQPTPPLFLPALAPHWPEVAPFAMIDGAQFRPTAPPALDSAAYTAAFNEVKSLGSASNSTRTEEQTQIARFWNDGLGTAFAFGYWNKIAQGVATDSDLDIVSDARLFALLNIATADAILSCWDAKYAYNLWRPVTAIRAADTDGNPDTIADATWTPLLGTPNFPSYTSAHSTVSAAAAGVLTALFGADYHFTVSSKALPDLTRSFDSFAAAAAEAGQSRIFGGIHYQFDNTTAQEVGAEVADYVLDNFLLATDGGDPLTAVAAAPTPVNVTLRAEQVQALMAEAFDVRIADRRGFTLAFGNTIWLDANAAKSGTLTFAPGETTKAITVEVWGDSKKEANETFYLDLFNLSSNALFTKNRGIGTILNDD